MASAIGNLQNYFVFVLRNTYLCVVHDQIVVAFHRVKYDNSGFFNFYFSVKYMGKLYKITKKVTGGSMEVEEEIDL